MSRPSLEERLAGLGINGLQPLGRGLEFSVFVGRPADGGGPVAVRVGERRFDSNANDPRVDTRALLRQEHRLTRLLSDHGLPYPSPSPSSSPRPRTSRTS